MGYHAVYENNFTNVYRQSDLGGGVIGNLTRGECFTYIGTNSYGNYEIRFRNGSGQYIAGFIEGYPRFDNLAYYGLSTSVVSVGSCYRFQLTRSLNVVTPSGARHTVLSAGDYVYTKTATSGASNPGNMLIVAFSKGGRVSAFNGFVTLLYSPGSVLGSSFCIKKG